eukprot:CAMPEP_0171380754 /NCGR_PEP_ID=MMETSP0879-20121228/30083_1 /TAXON_ID=67004 /ORGANISM="Thalassiosira weissflogii, Strain CCMP1336" /LENGTH=306 /DNA_ID=CAMNT_0011891983 /DNA_START=204 /DNA_END=1121 /DNA_ORIENTATION=-
MSKSSALVACAYFLLGATMASIFVQLNDSFSNQQYSELQPIAGNSTKILQQYSNHESTSKSHFKTIHLIGERHCGTKWITSHLEDCFGRGIRVFNRYTRWKHWFQYEDEEKYSPGSALVVSIFRDPYDWVESMRKRPYHSPNHFQLDWKTFLTRSWEMERGPGDKALLDSGLKHNTTCEHRFPFDEVIPCSRLDRNMWNGTMSGKPVGVTYELNHDGSGKPYNSILELRRDKIKNFLNVANFKGVGAFIPIQFEYMVTRGTGDLIEEVEKLTGIPARCERTEPQPLKAKHFEPQFIQWMNDHVDWD